MIIISDCLTSKVDEGCIKVASSLTKKIKNNNPNTWVVSYKRKPDFADEHLNLNKLFLNLELFKTCRKHDGEVLHIPVSSNTFGSILRLFVLSLFCGKQVNVIFVLRFQMMLAAKLLLKISHVNVLALSQESYDFYKEIIGVKAHYLKTGIDTQKYVPVDTKRKTELKEKHKIPGNKPVVLHVGHLKGNRNVDKLAVIDYKYYVLLVVSSVTEAEKDDNIRKQLEARPNTQIVDSYLPAIEEVYQLADVYLFPVQAKENCIDVPLSILEAASCGIPVVTTDYGEMKTFKGKTGFYFINKTTPATINNALTTVLNKQVDPFAIRSAVYPYDWQRSLDQIYQLMHEVKRDSSYAVKEK